MQRRRWHPSIVAGCTLVASALAGCALNPVTGRPQAVLTSEAGEIRKGAEAARAVEAQLGLVDDEKLVAYVRSIGRRLSEHSPRQGIEYHFYVVNMVEPNAFALPGGHVYVSRGLLALVNSEDELANVIGHEIGHVAARHSASREVRSAALLPARIAGSIGGLATSIVSPTLGRAVSGIAQLPGAVALASYSRGQENEADRLGQKMAGAAGWDPAAMASFMETLSREEELVKAEKRPLSFLASHPSSPARSAESRQFAGSVERVPADMIARTQESFLSRIEGIVVGPSAEEGVFVGTRFLQPELDLSLRFPDDWELRNKRHAVLARAPDQQSFLVLSVAGKGDDALEAARQYAEARGLDGEPRALRIGDLYAAHGFGKSGADLRLHLTWIAHGGSIYQVTGLSPRKLFEAQVPRFDATSRSFRPLTSKQADQVRESRLRFTEARKGERLARLLTRVGSSWSPEEAGVANALRPDAVLSGGTLVKFAHEEPYRRR